MAHKTIFQEEYKNDYTLGEVEQILFDRIGVKFNQPKTDEKTKFKKECENGVSIKKQENIHMNSSNNYGKNNQGLFKIS